MLNREGIRALQATVDERAATYDNPLESLSCPEFAQQSANDRKLFQRIVGPVFSRAFEILSAELSEKSMLAQDEVQPLLMDALTRAYADYQTTKGEAKTKELERLVLELLPADEVAAMQKAAPNVSPVVMLLMVNLPEIQKSLERSFTQIDANGRSFKRQ